MITEAEHNALNFLVFAISVLFLVIVGTIALSQLKKKSKNAESSTDAKLDSAGDDESRSTSTPAVTSHSPSLAASSSAELSVGTESAVTSKASIKDESGVPSGTDAKPTVSAEIAPDLNKALGSTRNSFFGRMKGIFSSNVSSSALDDIEEILYTSDLGPRTVEKFMESLRDGLSKSQLQDAESLRQLLRSEFQNIFSKIYTADTLAHHKISSRLKHANEKPTVIMVVGVNGAGKTTSIGKLSAVLAQEGHRVLVAAGDTFRAAAGSQLSVWTARAQVEIFSPPGVTDPSAVAFDAVSKAKSQGYDYVIIDTAGRLHTQANLMEELKKMKRVMTKVIVDAPHETLIVLDANQGQNALQQAKEFNQALQLTGCILTKMDGTAKGGVALGLVHEVEIPIKLVGVGEKITDLRVFQPEEFTNSILGEA